MNENPALQALIRVLETDPSQTIGQAIAQAVHLYGPVKSTGQGREDLFHIPDGQLAIALDKYVNLARAKAMSRRTQDR